MKEGDLIILDNDEQYKLLSGTIVDGNHYFLATRVKDEKVLEGTTCVLKECKENNEIYIEKIQDHSLLKKINKYLKDTTKK